MKPEDQAVGAWSLSGVSASVACHVAQSTFWSFSSVCCSWTTSSGISMVPSNDEATNTLMPSLVPGARVDDAHVGRPQHGGDGLGLRLEALGRVDAP